MKTLKKDRPYLSIVIPAFNEEGNLNKLYNELFKILLNLEISWEIIFVDDGSSDNTWHDIMLLNDQDQHVRGIRLSRNFGHQYALLAGLHEADGDAIISMDADLQHPPEIIPRLLAEWRKGNKIVKTVRADKEGVSEFKKFTSRAYYKLFSFLSGVKIKNGMADFRLLDRQVLNDILNFNEHTLFFRGIVQWVGYPNSIVEYNCCKRFRGQTKYSLLKMLKFAWHGISSFSLMPLRIATLLGLCASGLSFVAVLYAIVSKLWLGSSVPGWASSVAIISFLFGVMFAFLAILAEYIGKIVIEVRGRPRYIVSEKTDLIRRQ